MWVGRATVFLVGLAVILALVVGVASTALAANGQNFIIGNGLPDTLKNIATLPTKLTMQGTASGPALQVTQQSTNSGAKGIGVTVPAGKAPMTVNSTAGKATNLNADKLDGQDSTGFLAANGKAADSQLLDGKESDEILPFLRAQKDVRPDNTQAQTGSSATANTVPIMAPTDGYFVISGSVELFNYDTSTDQIFVLRATIDGAQTAGEAAVRLRPGDTVTQAFNVTVPVSAGQHSVTTEVLRATGSGSWYFNRNYLNVMFVPQGRGAVTDTSF
jgi:hypothetical protein